MNLPVKASLEIALLACAIEKQVNACIKVRDTLISNYKIKLGVGDQEGTVKFSTTVTGADSEETQKLKDTAIAEFTAKVNELMETETEDIPEKIHLPNDITIKPEILKPLVPFIVISG